MRYRDLSFFLVIYAIMINVFETRTRSNSMMNWGWSLLPCLKILSKLISLSLWVEKSLLAPLQMRLIFYECWGYWKVLKWSCKAEMINMCATATTHDIWTFRQDKKFNIIFQRQIFGINFSHFSLLRCWAISDVSWFQIAEQYLWIRTSSLIDSCAYHLVKSVTNSGYKHAEMLRMPGRVLFVGTRRASRVLPG